MSEQEAWASIDAVAKHLGIAKDTVYPCTESKMMPAHKVGRLWKFKLLRVDAWIDADDRDGEASRMLKKDGDAIRVVQCFESPVLEPRKCGAFSSVRGWHEAECWSCKAPAEPFCSTASA